MRKFKRLLAAILTAALAASLLVLPAGAAGSFSDVQDEATAVNADILRLMGVVSGVGNNQFNPGGSLTRAQFCTMAVKFLQRDSEARQYSTRTIFSDVPSSHWARQYINLAASIPVSEESGEGARTTYLVSGVGDGTFKPESNISMSEAVTILLRALGYSGKQAGAVWPQGYLDLAQSIGLTDGLAVGAFSEISRAQAAQLFVNALRCKTAKGEAYYKSLGDVPSEKSIILAVNVATDDGGSTGAVRTTNNSASEAYLPAGGSGNVPALQGKRGSLVLNDREEIVAFVPDDSTAITITLSGDAQAAFLKAAGGRQYTISGTAKVYNSASGEGKSYLEAYSTLTSGTQVTMYSEKGKIVAIYSTSSGTTVDSDAVVVMGTATTATFHQLTGGAANFNIIKNRQSIDLSQIKPYDVVTYDAISNTLVVSDLRLTAAYKDPAPTPKTPTTISIVGQKDVPVLSSAWNTMDDVKVGESVCLLLTADGKVAGIVKPNGKLRSTAIGMVSGSGVEIFLPNGGTMKLEGTVSNASNVENQLVSISASRDGFYASRLSTSGAPGDFNVNGMKLGGYTVTAGVRIYEQVQGGAMVEINQGDLASAVIPAGQIAGCHLNSSGMVDYIILNDVTGDAYEYGMMVGKATTVPGGVDENGNERPDSTHTDWTLVRGSGDIVFASSAGYNGRTGDMVGVVTGTPLSGGDGKTIKAIVRLTEIKVKASDFFESQGVPHVTVGGRTYRIADDVECCRGQGGSRSDLDWLSGTGAERLTAIKAYSSNLTIYVDPVGQQVRVIKAN